MRQADPSLPIGVFDSGVGGLTVLRALGRVLPGEDYLYLGDTARLPYGTKSRASVVRYALQSSRCLVAMGVKLLVVACNTASAAALPELQAAYPGLPVVGVIRPGARAGCAASATGRMAVIATESTVQGGAYQAAILEMRPAMRVEAQACSLFVALAEEGWTQGPLVEQIVARQLSPLLGRFGPKPPDSLVLGCTHFPVLARAIANVLGPDVAVIDSAATTAAEVRDLLVGQAMLRPGAGPDGDPDKGQNQGGNDGGDMGAGQGAGQGAGRTRFFATDGAERFARVGSIFLGRPLSPQDVTIVDL